PPQVYNEARTLAGEGCDRKSQLRRRSGNRTSRSLALDEGFDRALQLDGQGLAAPIDAVADGQAHPAFRDAVFLDVGLFLALEADAHAARQQVGVVEGAVRIDRKAVR